MGSLPKRQRVAAYAVILREERILLSRLPERSPRTSSGRCPGGGLDHGEDPRDAVVREVHEETGLYAEVGETARVYSAHLPGVWREGRRVDAHALRIVYDGWVPLDSPEPRVSRWTALPPTPPGSRSTTCSTGRSPWRRWSLEALADHLPHRKQRVAAYALVHPRRHVLLTRISERGHHAG